MKEEVMFRLLEENLDYGIFSEQAWEFDGAHDQEYSKRMEIRTAICEQVSHVWVFGEVKFLEAAQNFADALVKKFPT